MSLRSKIIRLAYEKPEYRDQLLPLVKNAIEFNSKEELEKYLQDHPDADRSNHSINPGVLGNLGAMLKNIGKAIFGAKKKKEEATKEKKEAEAKSSEATDMCNEKKKALMEKLGWGDMDPDKVKFVRVDGNFGAKDDKDNFEESDASKEEQDKILELQKAVEAAKAAVKESEAKLKEAEAELKKQEDKKAKVEKDMAEAEKKEKGGGKGKDVERKKSKAELIKEYQEAINKSDMSPEDKKKALEQSKKPNFDPEAALGAMGEDEEEGKTAMTIKKLIRIAYENPEHRERLLPIIQEASKTAKAKGPMQWGYNSWFGHGMIRDTEYALKDALKEYDAAASYRGAKGEKDAKKIIAGIEATLKTLDGASKAFNKLLKMEQDFINKHGLPEDYVNETSAAFGFRSSADIDE